MPVPAATYEFKEHAVISHPAMEEPWNVDIFRENFSISICSMEDTLEFDMINVDCSFANAIRRALIAEVPSVCIERVYLHQNTSIMPDEVFCHRLGLIPLTIDPKLLSFPVRSLPGSDDINEFNPSEHVLFDFHVQFNKSDAKLAHSGTAKDNVMEPNLPSVRSRSVYSSDLKWHPLPGQEEIFGDNPPVPVSDSILLNKLAVGDEIEASCLAVKGIGRDHAKFSPVSGAYYKFMPIIQLLGPIEGELALTLQRSFAPGVIGVHPDTQEAYVLNARLDNGSREHMRHPELRDLVSVGVDSSHCMFTVESIAPAHRPPTRLVRSAIDVLIEKCAHYLAITKTPGFGETSSVDQLKVQKAPKVKKSDDITVDGSNTNTELESARSQLNGREVGLEATHVSSDKRRVTYTFYGEDHTLGLALRFCVLHSTQATFCGYCVPHPLEDKIHFDIQVKTGTATESLQAGLQCMHDCFVHIKAAFKAAMAEFKRAR